MDSIASRTPAQRSDQRTSLSAEISHEKENAEAEMGEDIRISKIAGKKISDETKEGEEETSEA